jgi:broad specificity phosphatase PhoE
MVTAWVAGHPKFEGETWLSFHQRIADCRAAVRDSDTENVVVVTSATPIGIWTALSLDVADHRALRLAGVLHNASYTTMRLNGEHLRLHAFNATPHLTERDLLTTR